MLSSPAGKFLDSYRPWKQEHCFDIEHEEQDGKKVIANFKLGHALATCRDAAFVGFPFLRIEGAR